MRTGRGGVADLVLAADDAAVGQLGAERDALLGADGRQHEGALRDARDAREQEDGRLQRAEEQARAREEEVACAQRPPYFQLHSQAILTPRMRPVARRTSACN